MRHMLVKSSLNGQGNVGHQVCFAGVHHLLVLVLAVADYQE